MSTDTSKYERTDYGQLAKEFGCLFCIGKRGLKLLPKGPSGKIYKLFVIIPLAGWITNPKVIEHVMKERGYEL